MLMPIPQTVTNPIVQSVGLVSHRTSPSRLRACHTASASSLDGRIASAKRSSFAYWLRAVLSRFAKSLSTSCIVSPGLMSKLVLGHVREVMWMTGSLVIGSIAMGMGYTSSAQDISTMPHEARSHSSISKAINLDILDSYSVILLSLYRGNELRTFAMAADTDVQCFVAERVRSLVPSMYEVFASSKDAIWKRPKRGLIECKPIKRGEEGSPCC